MHIVTYIFIIEIIRVLLDFKNKYLNKCIDREILEHIVNACGSWFLMKSASRGFWIAHLAHQKQACHTQWIVILIIEDVGCSLIFLQR